MADQRIAEAQAWVESMLGEPFTGDFGEHLKSGVVLCNLINTLKPGTIKKVNKNRMPFMQMENINAYIDACKREFGIPDQYNFMTIDLFEAKNLGQVATNLVTLKRESGHGFEKAAVADQSGLVNLTEAADDSTDREIRAAEQPTETAGGLKRTGTALRPGQGVVAEERLAPNCKACGLSITAGFVNAVGTSWHIKCFTCKKCGKNIANAKYFEHENKAYCDRCILVVNPQSAVKATTRNMGFDFSK
mmetsp:Transcript_22499/g.89073  ORF Transcript_22499/g.89073 Transcript_22499/m.89073 type:complete len:247 (+) Transcript_22499:30-770(+)